MHAAIPGLQSKTPPARGMGHVQTVTLSLCPGISHAARQLIIGKAFCQRVQMFLKSRHVIIGVPRY